MTSRQRPREHHEPVLGTKTPNEYHADYFWEQASEEHSIGGARLYKRAAEKCKDVSGGTAEERKRIYRERYVTGPGN